MSIISLLRGNPPHNLWQNCQALNADVTITLPSGDKLCGPSTDSSVFELIVRYKGIYEPHVASELQRLLRPGMTFIDVGANLGYFVLMASRLVGPSGKVIAFEPNTIAYNYCKRNIELNGLDNVTLYKMGLWSEHKTLKITTLDQLGHNFIGDDGESIECIPLDSMNLKPDVIKMDIEGAEPFALAGMQKTLTHGPTLLLECNRFCLRNFFKVDAEAIWDQLPGYHIEALNPRRKISLGELKRICPPDQLVDLIGHAPGPNLCVASIPSPKELAAKVSK